ncbi:MAG: hypothetical protein EOM64_03590 [Erysipelotrichia bacterium]|nr:hypothetical protein [Erysipelotrichia bacterium]
MKKAEFSQFNEDQNISEARTRLIAELKMDSRVRQLFVNQNIPASVLETDAFRIDSWRKGTEVCTECTSLSSCRIKQKGMRPGLRYDGILNETIESCPYRDEQDQKESHCSRYLTSDLSEDMKTVSFENISLDHENGSYLKAMNASMQSCIASRGVYLYGNMGTGKTYLAACASNYHARSNESCAFVHYPSFCGRVSALTRTGEYRTEAERMTYASFLVIDDIGAEEVTDRNRALLLSILDARMQNRRCTWFTSNDDFSSLKNHFILTGHGEDTMEAARIMERIKALSIQIHLIGADRRDDNRSK